MSRKINILKYLYDLFTGKYLRDLQNIAKKQDDDISDMIATINGDTHWMLEVTKKKENNINNNKQTK